MIDNHLNLTHVLVRCSFDDQNGNVKTIQGYVMIESSTVGISPGALVKNDFSMQGNGKMDMFDGFVPCPTVITSITIGGQTAPDGIVHVTYAYAGSAYQIKYRLDGVGDYAYALADQQLDIPGLAIGSNHSIEIIPVCSNGYEGTGQVQQFIVTQALTCSGVISDITIILGSGGVVNRAVAIYSGGATQMKYQIDGGIWQVTSINSVVNLTFLPLGAHTITMVPICANNVEGAGFTKAFNVTVNPSQSVVQLHGNIAGSGVGAPRGAVNLIQLYVNGVLTLVNPGSGVTNQTVVPVGATIKGVVTTSQNRPMEIQTLNLTASTTLDDQTAVGPGTLQFSFVADGSTYRINGTLN